MSEAMANERLLLAESGRPICCYRNFDEPGFRLEPAVNHIRL